MPSPAALQAVTDVTGARGGTPALGRTTLIAVAGLAVAVIVAVALDAQSRAAATQAWPAFVLVTGLLLVGLVADEDGLFEWAAAQLVRVHLTPVALFGASLLGIAVVTALLNLDTSVVFLTPLLVYVARRAGISEEPFLYASVFMANASSLFLPGSNLTNLIVLAHAPTSGATFAWRVLPASAAAALVTAGGLLILFRRRLIRGAEIATPRPVRGVGALGATGGAAAAVLTIALSNPAPAVLGVGVALVAVRARAGRIPPGRALAAVNPAVTFSLFAAAVALGTLARAWSGPAHLLAGSGTWGTTAIGAVASGLVNNLPAAVLLSSHPLMHPRALLIGLNVGPNLAITGSLCAYLWLQAGRQVGSAPSIRAFSGRGIVLAPAAMAASLIALSLLMPAGL